MSSAREFDPARKDAAGVMPVPEQPEPRPIHAWPARIRTSMLISFCQRVGNATRAGIEARRLWETEARYGSGTHRRYVNVVREHVIRGDTVAEGMRACEGYFPSLVCEMVEVGERTGKLDQVFLKLADHYEHQQSLKRSFLIGIAWPSLQLVMGIFVVGLLIAVLGVLDAHSLRGEPIYVLIVPLSGVSGMLIFWAICAAVIGGIVLAVMAVMRGWLGPMPVRIAMRIPMLGTALANLALSRLTWSLAMGLDAGIDARRSAELAVRASQNPYYQSRGQVISSAIVRNRPFHEAFQEAGVFPEDFLQMLETAEIAGTTSESMQRLCREYEERSRNALRWLTWLTGIAIWLFIGCLLVAMIFRLAMIYLGTLYDAMEMTQPGRF